jgi:DNA replication protein DnaC
MSIKQITVHGVVIAFFLAIGIWIGTLYAEKRQSDIFVSFLAMNMDVLYLKDKLLLLKLAEENKNEALIGYLTSTMNSSVLILDGYSERLDSSEAQKVVNEAIAAVANYYEKHPQHLKDESPIMPQVKDALARAKRLNDAAK